MARPGILLDTFVRPEDCVEIVRKSEKAFGSAAQSRSDSPSRRSRK